MQGDFLGKGWPFPIRAEGQRITLVESSELVRRSIVLILSTSPGERVMRPSFGCGIHELVFQPNTPTLRGAVEARVRDALVRWEPRIDVLGVRAEPGPEGPHQLLIRVDYRLRTNNAIFNLVYPFFLNEGTP